MGSNAATGGGGSGVPDAIRPQKVRKKEMLKETIKKFSPVSIITGAIKKGMEESKRKRELDYESAAYGTKPSSFYAPPGGNDNDRGGNQVVQAPTETMATATAPTTAEVSQSAATDADAKEEDILYRKRKTKRTGRSMLVVTSPQGDTSGLTLGKRSLLGS